MNALKKAENKPKTASTEFADDEKIIVLGKSVVLKVLTGSKNKAEFSNGVLTLTVKDIYDYNLKESVYKAWRKEFAFEKLSECCERIYPIFEAVGIKYPQIKVREMKSRWGSCHTVKGVLTFNIKLIEVPYECIEYVVVHEFTHFLHPDHSKRFHNTMTKIMPDWKERRKLLNQ